MTASTRKRITGVGMRWLESGILIIDVSSTQR